MRTLEERVARVTKALIDDPPAETRLHALVNSKARFFTWFRDRASTELWDTYGQNDDEQKQLNADFNDRKKWETALRKICDDLWDVVSK